MNTYPQGAPYRAVYDLGDGIQVTVFTDHAPLLQYLDEFHDRVGIAVSGGWTIVARLADPVPGMTINPWGAGYQADPENRVLQRQVADPVFLRAGTQIAMREALVEDWENRGYTMLHAAAVRKDDLLILLMGNMRAGKTTLALNGAMQHGFEIVSNDHTVVYRDGDHLVVTEIPTVIAVRIASYLEMEDFLPQPYDLNGVDIEAWRKRPKQEQIEAGDEHVMYYSRASLRQPLRSSVRCGPGTGTRVVIVSPTFSSPASAPQRVADAGSLLPQHIRTKWAFDPNRNTHELPRDQRTPDVFLADGLALAAELADGAEAYVWAHDGNITPLLETLTAGRTA